MSGVEAGRTENPGTRHEGSGRLSPERAAGKIAGVYLAAGSLWIALSDRLIVLFLDDPSGITTVQTLKGWAFVLGSALLLYAVALQGFRAFARLGASDRRMAQVLEAIPAGVGWKGTDGRYRGCNARFARDMGLSGGEDVVGLRDADLPWLSGLPEMEGDEEALLEGRGESTERRYEIPDEEGRVRRLRVGRAPLRDHDGRVIGVLVCYEDETDRWQAEVQLGAAQRLNELGTLTAGVAHDFRNILAVIMANADLVARGGLAGAEAEHAFRDIRDAAESASGMVRKLLGFGKGRELRYEPVHLPEVLSQVAPMLSRMLTPSHPLRVVTPPDLPAVRADRDAVEHLLLNLVTNARDAMPEGGDIHIRAVPVAVGGDGEIQAGDDPGELGSFRRAPGGDRLIPGTYVGLSVRDEGTGIPGPLRDRVFEPFVTSRGAAGGTGLGLPMVLSLTRRQGGEVQLRTREGIGTEVRVLLPLSGEAVEVHAADAETGRDEGWNGDEQTILIVEDQEGLRRTMARVLERHGYRVIQARDGIEALELARAHRSTIDLVLSDSTMPRMGGMELRTRLRGEGLDLPFALTTGDPPVPDRTGGESIRVLPKPWTVRELLAGVQDLMEPTRSG